MAGGAKRAKASVFSERNGTATSRVHVEDVFMVSRRYIHGVTHRILRRHEGWSLLKRSALPYISARLCGIRRRLSALKSARCERERTEQFVARFSAVAGFPFDAGGQLAPFIAVPQSRMPRRDMLRTSGALAVAECCTLSQAAHMELRVRRCGRRFGMQRVQTIMTTMPA
jgi:hypothetical protein